MHDPGRCIFELLDDGGPQRGGDPTFVNALTNGDVAPKTAIAVRARGRRIRARAAQNTIPHSESTSPRSRQILADILDGVPEDEQAKIGKISSVYTFDVAKLTVPA